ncbi:MAG: hypothetical protein ACOC9Z_08290 [Chloroflexota bacterium]
MSICAQLLQALVGQHQVAGADAAELVTGPAVVDDAGSRARLYCLVLFE